MKYQNFMHSKIYIYMCVILYTCGNGSDWKTWIQVNFHSYKKMKQSGEVLVSYIPTKFAAPLLTPRPPPSFFFLHGYYLVLFVLGFSFYDDTHCAAHVRSSISCCPCQSLSSPLICSSLVLFLWPVKFPTFVIVVSHPNILHLYLSAS